MCAVDTLLSLQTTICSTALAEVDTGVTRRGAVFQLALTYCTTSDVVATRKTITKMATAAVYWSEYCVLWLDCPEAELRLPLLVCWSSFGFK